jgi:hypothetical protein
MAIAQRFNAGVDDPPQNESREGRKNHRIDNPCEQNASLPSLPGLVLSDHREPSVETPGYYQAEKGQTVMSETEAGEPADRGAFWEPRFAVAFQIRRN